MLGLELVLLEHLCGKVPEVEGDDQVCTAVDRCCEHMVITVIGEAQRRYQVLVARNKAVLRVGVHEVPRSLELLAAQIGAGLEQAPDPFLVDLVRPPGSEEARHCQVEEEVPQRRRVEDAGVVENCEPGHTQ